MCIEESWTINQWHHSWIVINYNALMSPWLDGVITTSPYFQHERTRGALEHLVSTGFRSRQYPHSMDKPWTTHGTKLSRILAIQIAVRLLLHRCDLFYAPAQRLWTFLTIALLHFLHLTSLPSHALAMAMALPVECHTLLSVDAQAKMESWLLNAWTFYSNSSLFLSQFKFVL